jgi:hypothetical protein
MDIKVGVKLGVKAVIDGVVSVKDEFASVKDTILFAIVNGYWSFLTFLT